MSDVLSNLEPSQNYAKVGDVVAFPSEPGHLMTVIRSQVESLVDVELAWFVNSIVQTIIVNRHSVQVITRKEKD